MSISIFLVIYYFTGTFNKFHVVIMQLLNSIMLLQRKTQGGVQEMCTSPITVTLSKMRISNIPIMYAITGALNELQKLIVQPPFEST